MAKIGDADATIAMATTNLITYISDDHMDLRQVLGIRVRQRIQEGPSLERQRAEEALSEIRESERSRIARDLRDVVLQDLILAMQRADLMSLHKPLHLLEVQFIADG